ncbi:MAG: hypothetical protein LBK46_04710 [Oscillospiraceae bacterium]|jgi:hypothetical protein|nr:hypothetical protein [Oscillospiraceae bacterium]
MAQFLCTPEKGDPRCGCRTCGRRDTTAQPWYGGSWHEGCRSVPLDCDCRFDGDGDLPEVLCRDPFQFEAIEDGTMTGAIGSICATEQRNGPDPSVCRPECHFNDGTPTEYCDALASKRNQTFEAIEDGTPTAFLFPPCANGANDPNTCTPSCNPRWAAELAAAQPLLCPEVQPFELAPDGYLMKVDMCKGAPLYVSGWCRRTKQRRPGKNLCGGLHMYTKVCMRLNLCGGLRMSY